MNNGELKPCPFCNCEMEIVAVGRDWWRIKPVDGHEDTCPLGECHEWDCSQGDPEWKGEHISDWNKRTTDRLGQENAELREALQESQKVMNTFGLIHGSSKYSKAEKCKRAENLMRIHMDDIFLANKELLNK